MPTDLIRGALSKLLIVFISVRSLVDNCEINNVFEFFLVPTVVTFLWDELMCGNEEKKKAAGT